jgi:hypothetical protein
MIQKRYGPSGVGSSENASYSDFGAAGVAFAPPKASGNPGGSGEPLAEALVEA